jgi:SAM-dependent methyltransferase
MARGEGQRRALTVVGGTRGELVRYASLVPEGGSSVLVLGAGDGRLAEELVRRGASVTAVDPSPRMVERAEEARASLPGEAQGRLNLFRADLRSLRLPQRFSAVFAPATRWPSGEPGGPRALFVTAREHLAQEGPSPSTSRCRPPLARPDDMDPHGLAPDRAVFTRICAVAAAGGDQGIHRLLLRHFTAREVTTR